MAQMARRAGVTVIPTLSYVLAVPGIALADCSAPPPLDRAVAEAEMAVLAVAGIGYLRRRSDPDIW